MTARGDLREEAPGTVTQLDNRRKPETGEPDLPREDDAKLLVDRDLVLWVRDELMTALDDGYRSPELPLILKCLDDLLGTPEALL